MKLFTEIKTAQLAARKAKDVLKTSALTCVMGDVQQVAKEPTDEQVHAVLRKHIKALSETIEHVKGKDELSESQARYSRKCLEMYMPCPMSDLEVSRIIGKLLMECDDADFNIGIVMRTVKAEALANGREFDGKQVQRVFAERQVITYA